MAAPHDWSKLSNMAKCDWLKGHRAVWLPNETSYFCGMKYCVLFCKDGFYINISLNFLQYQEMSLIFQGRLYFIVKQQEVKKADTLPL